MADREFFEREELYRERKPLRVDLLGTYHSLELTRRVVAENAGLLIASFHTSWAGHDQESLLGLLIEEIIAANPRASALEATVRELRRT